MIAFAKIKSVPRFVVGGTLYCTNMVRVIYKGERKMAQIVIKYPDSAMVVDVGSDEPGSHNKVRGCLVVNANAVSGTRAVGLCCDSCLTRVIRDLAVKLGFVFLDDPLDAFL